MQPPVKTTQRRLGYVEDLLTRKRGGRARVERYRRRMERKRWRRERGISERTGAQPVHKIRSQPGF